MYRRLLILCGVIIVKPQYLTGFLKAGIRPVSSRIPLDSASFEHPRFGVNQVLLTNMAMRTAVGSNCHNDDTFGPVGAAKESKSPARASELPASSRTKRSCQASPAFGRFLQWVVQATKTLGVRQTCSCRGESGSERNSLPLGYRWARHIDGFLRQWARFGSFAAPYRSGSSV